MTKIFASRDLKSITQDEWKTIVQHGVFRGYKIYRLAQAFDGPGFNPLLFTPDKNEISLNGIKINLKKAKRCKSKWSFARLLYIVKEALGCGEEIKDQTNALAEGIYKTVQDYYNSHLFFRDEMMALGASSDALNAFLDTNASRTAQYAVKYPQEWLVITQHMRNRLEATQDNDQIARRLTQLDAIITNGKKPYYPPFTPDILVNITTNLLLPEHVHKIAEGEKIDFNLYRWNKVKRWEKVKEAIARMRVLYKASPTEEVVLGGIEIKKFVNWLNQNRIPPAHYFLPEEEIAKMIPHTECIHLNHDLKNLTKFIKTAKNATELNINYAELECLDGLPNPDKVTRINLKLNSSNEWHGKPFIPKRKPEKIIDLSGFLSYIPHNTSQAHLDRIALYPLLQFNKLVHLEILAQHLTSSNLTLIELIETLPNLDKIIIVGKKWCTEKLDKIIMLRNQALEIKALERSGDTEKANELRKRYDELFKKLFP